MAVAGGGRELPCPAPRHPLASPAVTPAAAPRPARLLHAETHTPKSPWVKLLGSFQQLLFPSVPKPSEELVENKEVSAQGALSQSAGGLGSRGCSWRGLSSQEGQPAPAGPKAANLSSDHSPKYLPPRAAFPTGHCCLAQSQFAALFFKAVLVSPGRKLLVTQILNIEASPFFMRQMQNLCPTFIFGNRSFCQRSANRTPGFLSSEVTSWLWSFPEGTHGICSR